MLYFVGLKIFFIVFGGGFKDEFVGFFGLLILLFIFKLDEVWIVE